MTRVEAINELIYIKESFAQCELSYEALDIAIKALREPYQEAIRAIHTYYISEPEDDYDYGFMRGMLTAGTLIEELQTETLKEGETE